MNAESGSAESGSAESGSVGTENPRAERAPAAGADLVGWEAPHDSAVLHVTGRARYIDDMPLPADALHAALGLSTCAHGEIVSCDLAAVRSSPGVVDILSAADLAGVNDVSPVGKGDDPVFAEDRVLFYGQPLFAVIARTRRQARIAARRARVVYREKPACLDIDAALAAPQPDTVADPLTLERGDVEAEWKAAPHRLCGTIRIGGQDHFYLEGQIALALPGDDDAMTVWSSTQHPGEVQLTVAHALRCDAAAVTVKVRRMGGGFGGKETQGAAFAVIAAVAARRLRRPVKLRLDRDDDMIVTGKRHDFRIDYRVAFDDDGRFRAVEARIAARCGFSADLSGPVVDRAAFHADNAYHYPAVRLRTLPLRTHTVSNTAFRGFGGPQGMALAERLIVEIADRLGRDPLDIRKINLYGEGERSLTPYHQRVHDNVAPRLIDELAEESDYRERRRQIMAWNAADPIVKKGIALTPVKFGISFTATHYNQAGALVGVYRDGSIRLNHGGTEMGQGLLTKVGQTVADCFAVDLDRIRLSAASTDEIPNASATAASSGADLNAAAAFIAAARIKKRLIAFAAARDGLPEDCIVFEAGHVRLGNRRVSFSDLVADAYKERVKLWESGFYKTPDIHWDRASGRGRPFYYFAYGAAVSEAILDAQTGECRITRVDILHDAGRSLNPALDCGQIEGGFIQGMGWLTAEELAWDAQGRLRTHAPSTYKIPLASDRPVDFRMRLANWSANVEPTPGRSKAIGEPPLMLALSTLEALAMAAAAAAGVEGHARLDPPATPERILDAVARMRDHG